MRTFALTLSVAFAAACTTTEHSKPTDSDSGSYGRPDYIACEDTTTALDLADVSPLGFSGDDVLAMVAGPLSAAAEWSERAGAPTVTVSVMTAGTAIFHDLEPALDTGGAVAEGAPDGPCSDALELPVTVSFSTDDGAFAEHSTTAMWVTDLAYVSVGAALDPAALGGTFTFTEIDPAEWDSVTLDLSNSWTGDGITGQVSMQASREVGPNTGEGMIGPVLQWPSG